jgi:hypothetical protein
MFTVRNEADLIVPNLAYHRHLGVTDVFAFLDRSTDGTRHRFMNQPGSRIFEDLTSQQLFPYSAGKPDLDLDLIHRRFAAHNGVRQILHANMALELCRREGIDWLVNIDPDELLLPVSLGVGEGALRAFLAQAAPSTGAFVFENLEFIPQQVSPSPVFSGRAFKAPMPGIDFTGLPKSTLPDPFTKQVVPTGWFWGHTSGKLVVRVASAMGFSHLVSRFQTRGQIVRTKWLLHYNVLGFQHFLSKYRNFRDFPSHTSLGRPVRASRLLLVELVNGGRLGDDELKEYFQTNILYRPDEVAFIRERLPTAITEVTGPEAFFGTS